jgi:hypothetical protein
VDFTKFITPTGGITGLLAAVFLMVMWGKLVPRSYLDDVRADRDARLAEKQKEVDTWHLAYDRSEQARRIQAGHLNTLMEVARTTEHVISSLPAATSAIEEIENADAVAEG